MITGLKIKTFILAFCLALMAGVVSAAGLALAEGGAFNPPDFQSLGISSTATLPISQTASGPVVYFNNWQPGGLTLTFTVASTHPTTLSAGAAFNRSEESYDFPENTGSALFPLVLTYTVGTADGNQGAVAYTATNQAGITRTLTVTYVQDITPPTVAEFTTTVPGVVKTPEISFTWQAMDAGSGVYTAALLYRALPDDDWVQAEALTPAVTGQSITYKLTSPGKYEFGLAAADFVQNRITPTGGITVTYAPRIYLPLVFKNFKLLVNGDFKDGLAGWTASGGGFNVPGVGMRGSGAVPVAENGRAKLGFFTGTDGNLKMGYSQVSQQFLVEKQYLQICYQVETYDAVFATKTGKYYDDLEVSINQPLQDVTLRDPQCRFLQSSNANGILNPTTGITLTVPAGGGLVMCAGNPGGSPAHYVSPNGGGLVIDLNGRLNSLITLYLGVWNREYQSPYYNDRAYYKTWALIDNIKFIGTKAEANCSNPVSSNQQTGSTPILNTELAGTEPEH